MASSRLRPKELRENANALADRVPTDGALIPPIEDVLSMALRRHHSPTQAGDARPQALQGLDEMRKFPRQVWHKYGRDGSKNGTGTNKTINNQSLELSVALRDAGGLAWGGTELSGHDGDNGDFMHFDLRNDGVGAAVVSAMMKIRK